MNPSQTKSKQTKSNYYDTEIIMIYFTLASVQIVVHATISYKSGVLNYFLGVLYLGFWVLCVSMFRNDESIKGYSSGYLFVDCVILFLLGIYELINSCQRSCKIRKEAKISDINYGKSKKDDELKKTRCLKRNCLSLFLIIDKVFIAMILGLLIMITFINSLFIEDSIKGF
jgi:hypothetical protein